LLSLRLLALRLLLLSLLLLPGFFVGFLRRRYRVLDLRRDANCEQGREQQSCPANSAVTHSDFLPRHPRSDQQPVGHPEHQDARPEKQSDWCGQTVFAALTPPHGRQVTRQTPPRNALTSHCAKEG
jgi:hypothetical protein